MINRISIILLIILLYIFALTNYAILTLEEHDPFYIYSLDNIIHLFYQFSLILDLILLLILIGMLFNIKFIKSNKKNILKLMMIILIILVLLIWVELIYSSIKFYGGIGNHQNLLFGTNNLAFLGSFVFSFYLLILAVNNKSNFKYSKTLIFIIGSLLLIILHYLLFQLF